MIRTLEDAIAFARELDGTKLAIFVADWSGIRDLFDEEGLWEKARLDAWIAEHPSFAITAGPRVAIRYASQKLLDLWEVSTLEGAEKAYHRMIGGLGPWSASFLEAFRVGGVVEAEEAPTGQGPGYARVLRLHVPTRELPAAVTVVVDAPPEIAIARDQEHSAARYQAIVEDQTDFIVRYRPDGVRTYVNRPYAEYFGGTPEELVGSSFLSLIAPEHRPAVEEKVRRLVEREAEVLSDEHLSYRRDGTLCWTHWIDRAIFDARGNLVELQAVGRDVTERRQAEERRLELEIRLAQAEKMEAVGTLASGLAHDFNNTLTSIQGYASLIEADPADAEHVAEYARCLTEATERAAELTGKLLRLSRRAPRSVADYDVRSVVDAAARLLRSAVPDRIEVRAQADDLPLLQGDGSELTQAIVNLGFNARDAIEGRGLIEIAAQRAGEEDREQVVVRVRDDGSGIPQDVLPRVFEPLFTTKSAEEGTGLGLAMVYSCAKAHGGRVEIDSEVGRGTTVHLYLPCRTNPSGQR